MNPNEHASAVAQQIKPRMFLAASVWICETEDATGFGHCQKEAYEEWKFDRDAGRIALGEGS